MHRPPSQLFWSLKPLAAQSIFLHSFTLVLIFSDISIHTFTQQTFTEHLFIGHVVVGETQCRVAPEKAQTPAYQHVTGEGACADRPSHPSLPRVEDDYVSGAPGTIQEKWPCWSLHPTLSYSLLPYLSTWLYLLTPMGHTHIIITTAFIAFKNPKFKHKLTPTFLSGDHCSSDPPISCSASPALNLLISLLFHYPLAFSHLQNKWETQTWDNISSQRFPRTRSGPGSLGITATDASLCPPAQEWSCFNVFILWVTPVQPLATPSVTSPKPHNKLPLFKLLKFFCILL